MEIEPALLERLVRYSWPGNVRQLRNVLRTMLALRTCDRLTLADFNEEWLAGGAPVEQPRHGQAAGVGSRCRRRERAERRRARCAAPHARILPMERQRRGGASAHQPPDDVSQDASPRTPAPRTHGTLGQSRSLSDIDGRRVQPRSEARQSWRQCQIHPRLTTESSTALRTSPAARSPASARSNPVTVQDRLNVAFNHACGCTKCWKPEGATVLVVGVAARDKLSVTANAQQAQDRGREGRDPAPCLHRLWRAHVWPHREQEAPVLWLRFLPCRAVEGAGLGGAAVRGLRVLDHRVGHQARPDGRDACAV